MKKVPLSEVKDDLSRFLREAERHEIVITRHGKPAGVLIGFESEDDWFEYRRDRSCFLRRIEEARANIRAGRGVRLRMWTRLTARAFAVGGRVENAPAQLQLRKKTAAGLAGGPSSTGRRERGPDGVLWRLDKLNR
jgi:prevent-host-death family protein